ncbi:MAG: hypothetical protein BTN85_2013 [Candidatus Methanohalarchaeum thermophilum]|uniref:Uncharacterized protein n=1 Tax=Methanohalarchaeum thermophilum TaxID=1903181 RepID=A0A1Q6DSN9_METT1|nr:MAG: hypothetical protein BTN85_2013 [Candidatus Methanohalarchaeum thermophilum]
MDSKDSKIKFNLKTLKGKNIVGGILLKEKI